MKNIKEVQDAKPETLKENKLEVLPQSNIEIERAVLYCLVSDSGVRENIDKIGTEDFYFEEHRKIFNGLNFKDKNFDVLLVPESIKRNKAYLELFGKDYLISRFDFYLAELKKLTVKRKLENICYSTVVKIREGKEISDIKDSVRREVEDLIILKDKKSIGIKEVDLELDEYFKNKNKNIIKTGYSRLDNFLSGFRKGFFYIIGGIPAAGKTTFTLNFLNNVCSKGYRVLLTSLEMPYREIATKIISQVARINTNSIERFEDEKDLVIVKKIIEAREKISKYNLEFAGADKITVSEIENIIKDNPRDVIFIDYLQRLKTSEGVSGYEKISAISSDIKILALKYDIPVVAVSSVNRDYSDRANKEPILSDLRGSGNLEFDADVVMLLYRKSQFDDEAERDEAKVIIAKNRYGISNINIDLVWKPKENRFFEREERYEKDNKKERKDIYG